MWIKQSHYKTLKPNQILFINKCITEVRGEKTTLEEVITEKWNPYLFLLANKGMLRAGKLSSKLQQDVKERTQIEFPSTTIYVAGVVILPRYRQMGYGKELFEALIQKFGGKDMILEVDKKNKNAIKLYKSYGFKIVNTNPLGYGMLRRHTV